MDPLQGEDRADLRGGAGGEAGLIMDGSIANYRYDRAA